MYLLSFSQGEQIFNIGLFECIEEGRNFVKQIPGYELKEESGFLYEYFNPRLLSEYAEIEYLGNIFPLTKYMFLDSSNVDIEWNYIPNFSKTGFGIVEGTIRVDAYSIENDEVKEYVKKRDNQYLKVKKILEFDGFEVSRNFFGSEDGEAIVYKKKGEKEWHFLIHMDPEFVENEKIEILIDELIKR